jgi:hypothetical protein
MKLLVDGAKKVTVKNVCLIIKQNVQMECVNASLVQVQLEGFARQVIMSVFGDNNNFQFVKIFLDCQLCVTSVK